MELVAWQTTYRSEEQHRQYRFVDYLLHYYSEDFGTENICHREADADG